MLSRCNLLLIGKYAGSSYDGYSTISVFAPVSQMDIASLSLLLSLSISMHSPINREICRSHNNSDIVPVSACFALLSQMDIASLPVSMQSAIDREICISRITQIVQFLCFHCCIDGHTLSFSLALSLSVYAISYQ